MKKTNFVLGALALIMSAALVFTGCNHDPEPEPEAITYTVTFDSNGGSTVDSVTVNENATVTKPEDPTRDGYDFGGWFLGDSETAYDFEDVVTSDLTLKAAWSEKTYTIAYELNGGTNAETNPTSYKISSDDITLADPTGPEATPNFVAWHKDTIDGETVQTIKKGSTGNITLVAEFSAKAIFKVIYYNGETVLGEVSVAEGGKIENKTYTVDGYILEGWYTEAELTNEIKDFTKTEVKAETKVYGKFVKGYTVTFDKADGSETATSKKAVKEGGKVEKPTDPTREGYKFLGWYVSDNKFDFNTVITEDMTVTAKWWSMPVAPAGLEVPLNAAISGYGADISNVNNFLKIVTPATPASDYAGYSQVQIALPATKDPVEKIAVIFKNNAKIKINFQEAGADPWGSLILTDANAKYFEANEDFIMTEIDLPTNAKFITFGSAGVMNYEIQVAQIILVGAEAKPVVLGNYKEYTLTTTEDCDNASILGFRVQVANTQEGEKTAAGDTFTIKGVKIELTIDGAKQTIDLQDLTLTPDQYNPKAEGGAYAVSNTRKVIGLGEIAIPAGTEVKVKALSGSIEGDAASRKGEVIFCLQENGGAYKIITGWNTLFADAE